MGALGTAVVAFMLSEWSGAGGALVMLAAGAILLDAATQFNQVVRQRVIYAIAPEARGRITSVYMTAVFPGGATGSLLAPATLICGGWTALSLTGAGMIAAAFLLFLTEKFLPSRVASPMNCIEPASGFHTTR